ncbi:MAG: VRR-NUC domain-containing protein, partial [Gammaproteobacteria bacterium]|nr:VRR-NUC domain-containing protein [Gammaproteobacteria bacterium]
VENVYADILEAEQLAFLTEFRSLTEDSQKLYIRLLNRSSLWFRLSKLKYPEIDSISEAALRLQRAGFIQLDTAFEIEHIANLFSKKELLALHPKPEQLKNLKRDELKDYLLAEIDQAFLNHLLDSDNFIKVEQKNTYLLVQMLFFGNLNQSMTDFVLRDLGLYQFESYRIDAESRPFTTGLEIEQYWLLHELDALVQLSDSDDTGSLLACFASMPEAARPESPVYRKTERLKYDIARQIERVGELDQALDLYNQCNQPPARERIARIYHQQKNIEASIDMCRQIIDSPVDEAELQFANEFSTRLVKRHRLEPVVEVRQYQPEIVELKLNHHSSVELAVAEHYQSSHPGQQCYFLENSLFNGVLGLLIWDAIFEPLPGAFYHPFQYQPSDFYAHDFVQNRKDIFNRIESSFKNNDDIWNIVSACWEKKQGLMNPLVDWHNLDLAIIKLALQRIDHQHWQRIFQRILSDLRNHRAGFPDLILFPVNEGYRLIEVKGPGDKLQKNQQRWMAYFADHGIPHELARVSWINQPVTET